MGKVWLRIRAKLSTAPVVVLFEDGRARKVKGNISNALLSDFTDAAASNGIDHGYITVVKEGGNPVLHFVGPFNGSAKQRFRNIWFSQPERRMIRV